MLVISDIKVQGNLYRTIRKYTIVIVAHVVHANKV